MKPVTIDDVKQFTFPNLGDDRGSLVVIEAGENKILPFEIKRIFYMWGADTDSIRGQHANKLSTFCLINVCGESTVKVIGQDGREQIYNLSAPNMGLYIPAMLWKDMYNFSNDSILLVLADTHYDKTEYITDLEEYLALVGEING